MSILNKNYVTTMPDGSKWAVPVKVIAESRAAYYAKDFGGDIEKSISNDTEPLFESDEYEIEDWAQNNMNWDDVVGRAACIKPPECDYQEGWINGIHDII